jgi:tRNA (guanine37-N1)-methyltransferase
MFSGPFDESLIAKARVNGILDLRLVDLRDYTHDKHRTADDYPYGGGVGMLMKPEPLFEAIDALRSEAPHPYVIFTSPQGERFSQAMAEELAGKERLAVICGHYEGVDERVMTLVDREISIGDYVLTGGELPALVIIETVVRLLPGVLGDRDSVSEDTFTSGLLKYPQYTRPREIRGLAVPEVLLSGDHARIARWRRRESLRRTALRRPDLLTETTLSDEDRRLLREIAAEENRRSD